MKLLSNTGFYFLIWMGLAFGFIPAFGQEEQSNGNHQFLSEAGGRIGKGQSGCQQAIWSQWSFGKSKRFSLSPGIRFSQHWISGSDFISAPAKLASKKELLDTFHVNTGFLAAFNLALDIRYQLTSKFALGFSIDLAGFTLGNSVKGEIGSSSGTFFPAAKPTSGNLLLVDNNDIGTLYSSFYIQYSVTERVSIKAGLCHVFTEYTTDKSYIPNIENRRYRSKHNGLELGFQYRLGN